MNSPKHDQALALRINRRQRGILDYLRPAFCEASFLLLLLKPIPKDYAEAPKKTTRQYSLCSWF
ncbi:MAG: hypothetical protein ACXADX_20615, partial [Candidatus Hodarchaeales archaeon]